MRQNVELKDNFLPVSDFFSAQLEIEIFSKDKNFVEMDFPVLVHNIFLNFSYDIPIQESQISKFEEKLNLYFSNFTILGIECDTVKPIRYNSEYGRFEGVFKRDNKTIINRHNIPDQVIHLKEPFYEFGNIDDHIRYDHRASPFERNRAPSRTGIKRSSSANFLGNS
jgi:hypothetical protein